MLGRSLLALFLLLSPALLGGQPAYPVDTLYPVHDLDGHLWVVPDSTDELSPSRLLYDSTLVWKARSDYPRLLPNGLPYWGRVKLALNGPISGWQLQLRDICPKCTAWIRGNGAVDVYAYRGKSLLFHRRTGVDIPAVERDLPGNYLLNRVEVSFPSDTITLLLRVKGNSFGFYPNFGVSLRAPGFFNDHPLLEPIPSFNIFLFGVTFIIFLYHLLLFVYLRQPIFFWFSVWLLLCTLTQAMTVTIDPVALFPQLPSFRIYLWLIIPQLMLLSFWMFGREFVESRKKFPRLDRFMLAIPGFLVLDTLAHVLYYHFFSPSLHATIFGLKYQMIAFFGLAGLILAIVITAQKDPFARYFGGGAIVANILIIIGALWSLQLFRLHFDPYAISIFLQIIIYSFGIAFRQQQIQLRNKKTELSAQSARSEVLRMRDLDEVKSRFFSNISHELRTPLTLINGPLAEIEEGRKQSKTPPTAPISMDVASFSLLRRNVHRLRNLVDQLLDLSRLENERVFLQLQRGGLITFVRSVVFSFESMADRKHISMNTSFPPELDSAYYDRDKLEKILTNLVENALKYTPPGGSVTVVMHYDEDAFYLEVSDTGAGIPEAEMSRIFDRFYRIEGTEAKGSGIGLALTKELIDIYGGRIKVDSTRGVGSRFSVRLPYRLEQLPDETAIIPPTDPPTETLPEQPTSLAIAAEESTVSKGKQRATVLVVEDNEDLRAFIESILRNHYHIITAVDGDQGERLAFEHIPDLVITDLMMPGKDGLALCHSLKTNVKTSHIPVVMLTAKAGQENKLAGLLQGADAYLTKPFDAKELRLTLNNLIEARNRLWKHFQSLDLSLVTDPDINSMDDSFLQSVIATIKDKLDDEYFGVDDLASSVGFSRSQLTRKLKALTGETPKALIIDIRLNEARRMLEHRLGTVSEIAYSVGYANMSYFTKSFKEKFGVLPSKVRAAKRVPPA